MNLEQIKKYFISLGLEENDINEIINKNKKSSEQDIVEKLFNCIKYKINNEKDTDIIIKYINNYFKTDTLTNCINSLNELSELLNKCNVVFTNELYDLISSQTNKLDIAIKIITVNNETYTKTIKKKLSDYSIEIIELYCDKNDEFFIQTDNEKEMIDEEIDYEDEDFDKEKILSTEKYLKNVFGSTIFNVKDVELLPEEKVYELATKYKESRDIKARNEIIVHNIRLVFSIANKFTHIQGVEFEDLVSVGVIGLMKALEKYDPDRAKFSTYATWWIKQTILRYINDNNRLIRIPVHKQEEISIYIKTRNKLSTEKEREVSDEEIAEYLKKPVETIKEYKSLLQPIDSLNKPIGDDDESVLGDFISDNEQLSPEEKCLMNDNSKINFLLSKLKEDERVIIQIRYGFYDGKNHTLEEAANLLYTLGYKNSPLTRERVRQIEEKAMRKMRLAAAHYEKPRNVEEDILKIEQLLNEYSHIMNTTDLLVLREILNSLSKEELNALKKYSKGNIIGADFSNLDISDKRQIVFEILPKIKVIKDKIISRLILNPVEREIVPSNIFQRFNYSNSFEETKNKVTEAINNLTYEEQKAIGDFYDIFNTGAYMGDINEIYLSRKTILYLVKLIEKQIPKNAKRKIKN